MIRHRCSIIQSISLGFGALTENQIRLLTPLFPATPLLTAKILPELPRGEASGGDVIWKTGANPPQQQLFPNHNNLGKGCGLYFMGGKGPRMLIYLFPPSALRCMRTCACDKMAHRLLFIFIGIQHRRIVLLWRILLQLELCSHDEYVKVINFMRPNIIMNVWNVETLVEPVLSSSLTFIDATSSMGTITWRAISYFKYANINVVQPQTVYIQKRSGLRHRNLFLKCHSGSIF